MFDWLSTRAPARSQVSACAHVRRLQLETLEARITPSTLPAGFAETTVASGLKSPTAMAMAPDGRIFILEQAGRIRVVTPTGQLLATPAATLNVDSQSERGLLGIAFDPGFASNHFLYLYYTVPAPANGSPHNRVSRFTVSGNTVQLSTQRILLELPGLVPGNHNGGAIHFGKDGKLYIAVGDNGNVNQTQSTNSLFGKILRINADGTIPADNPFFGSTTGNFRSIWAVGLRNPYTFAVQPGTGRIFINDVGAQTEEEIDDGIAGANYGWPDEEGGLEPNEQPNPAFTYPLLSYMHGDTNTTGRAITGGAFYNPTNTKFPAEYVGDYFFADFANRWIRVFDPVANTNTLFASSTPFGIIDLQVDNGGSLYYLARVSSTPGDEAGVLVRIHQGAFSPEQRFVRTLFQKFQGTVGTTAQQQPWVSRVRGDGLAGVALGISRTRETHLYLARQLLQHYLGNSSNASVVSYYADFFDRGNTLETVASGLLSTQAFRNRANALIGGTDANANFVRALCDILLDRAATNNEVAHFTGQMQQGVSRQTIAYRFLASAGFRTIAVRAYFGVDPSPVGYLPNLLGRTSVPGSAIDFWVQSGRDLLTMATQFAGTLEFYYRA